MNKIGADPKKAQVGEWPAWASRKKCYRLGGSTRNLFSHSLEKSKIMVGTSQQFSFWCKLSLWLTDRSCLLGSSQGLFLLLELG